MRFLMTLMMLILSTSAFAEGEATTPAAEAPSAPATEAQGKMESTPVEKTSQLESNKPVKAAARKRKRETEAKKVEAKKAEAKAAATSRPDGLVVEDVKAGNGAEAKLGSKITVHYRGTLKDSGKEFDSSYGKDPITFDLIEGRLIKGWTEGIPGMKVGGKRKLSIPYAMAYGERGTPDGAIPPKKDLNFEVELIDVK